MDLVSQAAGVDAGDGAQEASALNVELTRRIRDGDAAAEGQMIRHLQPGLRLLLSRRLGSNWALIDDLVQETLLVVLKRLRGQGLDDPGSLAAFAAQTARNLSIGVVRTEHRRRTDVDNEALDQLAAPAPQIDSEVFDDEATWAVRKLLSELPNTRDRLLLKRFYLEDDDKETLCREFEMNEAALNQALSRARGRFRAIIERRGLSKSDLLEVTT